MLLHGCGLEVICMCYVLPLEVVWFCGDLVLEGSYCLYTLWNNYMIMVWLFVLGLCIGSYLLFCLRGFWMVSVVCWV